MATVGHGENRADPGMTPTEDQLDLIARWLGLRLSITELCQALPHYNPFMPYVIAKLRQSLREAEDDLVTAGLGQRT